MQNILIDNFCFILSYHYSHEKLLNYQDNIPDRKIKVKEILLGDSLMWCVEIFVEFLLQFSRWFYIICFNACCNLKYFFCKTTNLNILKTSIMCKIATPTRWRAEHYVTNHMPVARMFDVKGILCVQNCLCYCETKTKF